MKKVLSFVLILALVLSSFSMAFAGTGSATELKSLSDIAGNTNEEAIEVNYDLGVVTGNPDGTFQPAKAVTRAEFAAMLTRALAIPQSALAGYANTSFKDTTGYTWAVPYLAFCNSKGIILGDGAGNAMPGKTITVNEAVTMTLRAIGYTANSAELTGVWPSNYVTKAQELDLYDDVAKDAAGVDKANAAQIIYNVLTVQKVAVNSDGKTEKLWDKYDDVNKIYTKTTLLSSGLNCTAEDKDVVTVADIDDSVINMAKHIGQYGTIYKNKDKEIVAFIADCDQLTGRFYKDGSDIKFKTTGDEVEYNVKATTTAAMDLTAGTGSSTINVDTITEADEYVVNADLSGKTIKQAYSAVKWTVTDGKQIEKGDITEITEDQELLGKDFVLTDNDKIDLTQFVLVGAKSLSDIKEDNVVYVYADKNDEIRKVEVGTQTAEGIVKSFKNSKDHVATKFAIGANTYKNASEVVNGVATTADHDAINVDDVSESVKAFLDARGFVFDFESSDKATNYAVVEIQDDNKINDQAKLMFADGTEKVTTFDLDGGKTAFNNNVSEGAVLGYALNKDGKITEVNTNTAVAAQATLASINVINYDGKTAKVDDKVVVFTYDKAKDEYDVSSIDKVETNKALVKDPAVKVILLFDDDKGFGTHDKVVAMIIDKNSAKGGNSSFAVINEYSKTANDDGDRVYQVVGFKDGAKLDTLTDDENGVFSATPGTPDYTKADTIQVYEIKVDAKGVITNADLVTTGNPDSDYVKTGILTAKSVDGRKSITDASGKTYALSKKVAIYQVKDDDYKAVTSGSLKANDQFYLYEVDDADDAAGYDIVIFHRP